MNKAVMLSTKPIWCVMISIGAKKVELRKTRPKIEPPFKCYIYETQAESDAPWVDEDGHFIYKGRGAVIGEFVCDWTRDIIVFPSGYIPQCIIEEANLNNSCLSHEQIASYIGNGKNGYSWHISDLVIYDTPRPLSDFGLRRPPQSWCYVKEVNE